MTLFSVLIIVQENGQQVDVNYLFFNFSLLVFILFITQLDLV